MIFSTYENPIYLSCAYKAKQVWVLCESVRVCIHTQRSFSAVTGSPDDSVSQNHTIGPLFPLISLSNTHTQHTQSTGQMEIK